jgi:hypothetical protein
MREGRKRFAVELTASVASAALAAVTLVRRDWIEAVFQVDPDAGSGLLEWLVVASLVAATIGFAVAARAERLRMQVACGPSRRW